MARYKAFIEMTKGDGTVGAISLHRKANEMILGVNGKRVGIEVHASAPGDSDLFLLYATPGHLGVSSRVYLGCVSLKGGSPAFEQAAFAAREEA